MVAIENPSKSAAVCENSQTTNNHATFPPPKSEACFQHQQAVCTLDMGDFVVDSNDDFSLMQDPQPFLFKYQRHFEKWFTKESSFKCLLHES